jgi:HD-like signal output (HDOD) protein
MNCDGRAPSLNQLIDLVAKDPWLTAQVLISANQLERDDMTPIEDVRLAVTLCGYDRLSAMAQAMPHVEERHMRVLPASFAHYWMFQVAVARIADYAAHQLEFSDLAPNAYTAGLMHDFGRLLLAKLHPYSFEAITTYAKKHDLPLREAEKKFIGWTVRELGDYFARKHGLPAIYCDVIRWVSTPEESNPHASMIALVSLARHLCLANHLGFSGEPYHTPPPLEDSAAWQILRPRAFPSFSLKKFESQTNHLCASLKTELAGQIDVVA